MKPPKKCNTLTEMILSPLTYIRIKISLYIYTKVPIKIFSMPLSGKDSRNLLFTYITGFLDVINYSLIIPILPYIVEEMEASDMESGILYSGYSLMQMISIVVFMRVTHRFIDCRCS